MRPYKSLVVRHYWAKVEDIPYTGDGQRIAIELLCCFILWPIIIYCYKTPGIELFFAGYIVPALMITLGVIVSLKDLILECYQKKKSQN